MRGFFVQEVSRTPSPRTHRAHRGPALMIPLGENVGYVGCASQRGPRGGLATSATNGQFRPEADMKVPVSAVQSRPRPPYESRACEKSQALLIWRSLASPCSIPAGWKVSTPARAMPTRRVNSLPPRKFRVSVNSSTFRWNGERRNPQRPGYSGFCRSSVFGSAMRFGRHDIWSSWLAVFP